MNLFLMMAAGQLPASLLFFPISWILLKKIQGWGEKLPWWGAILGVVVTMFTAGAAQLGFTAMLGRDASMEPGISAAMSLGLPIACAIIVAYACYALKIAKPKVADNVLS